MSRGPRAERLRRRWLGRARVGEAAVLVLAAAAAQKWVPMTRWSRALGESAAVPDSWRNHVIEELPTRAANLTERRVRRAVHRAGERLPFQPSCLARATAAQVMLRRRGNAGLVVIGLRPSEIEPWGAHAWLIGEVGALTGGPEARGFTAVSVFELPGGPSPDDIVIDLRDAVAGDSPTRPAGSDQPHDAGRTAKTPASA